jgi:hypothetical protein
MPPAGLGAACLSFQLGRDPLVWLPSGLGAMPGMPVRVGPVIGCLRQRVVRGPPFLRGRRPVHRRPRQRVPEGHPLADGQQSGLLGRRSRLRRDAQPLRCPPHQHWLADRFRRGDQQQPLSVGRENLEPAPETLLDPSRQASPIQDAEPACQLRKGQRARQLQQGQRVASRLGEDPVLHPLIQLSPDR